MKLCAMERVYESYLNNNNSEDSSLKLLLLTHMALYWAKTVQSFGPVGSCNGMSVVVYIAIAKSIFSISCFLVEWV